MFFFATAYPHTRHSGPTFSEISCEVVMGFTVRQTRALCSRLYDIVHFHRSFLEFSTVITKALPCPACGFKTMRDAYGSGAICSICYWVDDASQLANPCSVSKKNAQSLQKKQRIVQSKISPDLRISGGFARASAWRPLNEAEIKRFSAEANIHKWINRPVYSEQDAYWHPKKKGEGRRGQR